MKEREQTPTVKNPWPVGSVVFWDYPHEDFAAAEVTVIEVPPYCRHYSFVKVKLANGQTADAIYSELIALKK